MKKILSILIIALVILGLCSCDPYAEDMESMQNKIAELEQQLKETDKENETERTRLQNEIDILRSRIGNVETRVTALETISAKVSDIEALTSQLEEMIEFNEDIDFVVMTLTSQLADLGDKLEGYYKAYKNDIEALDSEYALALLATNEDLEALEKVVDTLDTSLEDTNKEVTTLKRTLSSTSSKVQALSNNLTTQGIKIDALEDAIGRERYKIDTLLAEEGYHVIVDEITGEILEIEKHNMVHTGGTEECCKKDYCSICGYVEFESAHHDYDNKPLIDTFTGKSITLEMTNRTSAGSYWVWEFPQFEFCNSFYCATCGYTTSENLNEVRELCSFRPKPYLGETFTEDEYGYWGTGAVTEDTDVIYKLKDRMSGMNIYVECSSEAKTSNKIGGDVVAVEYRNRVWVARDNLNNWIDGNHTLHLLNKDATHVEKNDGRYTVSQLSFRLEDPEPVNGIVDETTMKIIL